MDAEERRAQERQIIQFMDPMPATIIDVGVGPGTEAWTLREGYIEGRPQIIGLEPHPDRFVELQVLNTYPGTLLPMGVWKTPCSKVLYWKPANDKAKPAPSVYCDAGAEYGRSFGISCTTIDHLVAYYKLQAPALLWADIEGAELEMLYGAVGALDNVIKYINLEVRDEPRTEGAATFEQINTFLGMHGFKCVHEYGWSDDVFRDAIWVKT